MSLLILVKTEGTGEIVVEDPWLMKIYGSDRDFGIAVGADSEGNPYIGGYTESHGNGDDDYMYIAKINKAGTMNWQRAIGVGNFDTNLWGNSKIGVDSADNFYSTGSTTATGAGGLDLLIQKTNNVGTSQWRRVLGAAGTEYGNAIAVTPAGTVYVTGQANPGPIGSLDTIIAKYDTNGVIQWQRVLGTVGAIEDGNAIAVDSSENVYILGQTRSGTFTNRGFYVVKYDSSGTLLWQRTLDGDANEYMGGIAVDSSGNVYCSGSSDSTGGYGSRDIVVFKYNTSGVLQWQRRMGATGHQIGSNLAIDSSGDVYVCGRDSAGLQFGVIAKWNTNGVLQWARKLENVTQTNSVSFNGIEVSESTGSLLLVGVEQDDVTVQDILVFSTHMDGSQTGNYGPNIDYATVTYSEAAATLTDAAGSMTSQAGSFTDAAGGLTQVGTSFPVTTYLKT